MLIFFLICLFFSFSTEYTINPCDFNEIYDVPQDETTLTIICTSSSIIDLSPLSALGALQNLNTLSLQLALNSIEDISPLSILGTLQNLNTLSLYFGKNSIVDISSLSILGTLQNLNYLYMNFYHNSIVNISPLSALGTLHNLNQLYLNFRQNSIEDIFPLSALGALQNLNELTLYFRYNSIEDIFSLNWLGSLQNLYSLTLYFQQNQINDYCPLIFLPNYTMSVQFKLYLDTSPSSFTSYSDLETYLISQGCPSAECHYSCENCKVSHSANNCIKCNEENHRLEFFQGNYYGQCICQEGYYDNYQNSLCQKCQDFCSVCFYNYNNNKVTCSECYENYTKLNNNCYLLNIENCQVYKIENKLQCEACKDGYYQNQNEGTCDQCNIKYCKNCLNAIICEQCENNLIQQEEGLNCTCPEGLFLKNDLNNLQCVSCQYFNNNCNKCDEKGKCILCNSNYFLVPQNNECVSICQSIKRDSYGDQLTHQCEKCNGCPFCLGNSTKDCISFQFIATEINKYSFEIAPNLETLNISLYEIADELQSNALQYFQFNITMILPYFQTISQNLVNQINSYIIFDLQTLTNKMKQNIICQIQASRKFFKEKDKCLYSKRDIILAYAPIE